MPNLTPGFNADELATRGVRELSPYVPGRNADQLREEYGIDHWVALASNENPHGPSPRVVRALNEFDSSLGRYPDGAGTALREQIAQYHNRIVADDHDDDESPINAAQVTLGNGSDDVLVLITRTFADSKHSVVFSQHSFAMYPIAAQSVGARCIVTPAINYGHDLTAMAQAIEADTRLVFVANPNNPTGTCVFDTELRQFMEQVPDSTIVVIDQAYAEYLDDPAYSDCTGWITAYPNLIVTRTFSKIHGLAGLRCGYAVSSAQIAGLLNRVRGPFNVNALAMKAAIIAVQDADYVNDCRQLNKDGLAQLYAGFDALNLSYVPSRGNFVLVDVNQAADAVFDALLRQGIIVRPVANYELPNHLRITVGTPEENVAVLSALDYILNSPSAT